MNKYKVIVRDNKSDIWKKTKKWLSTLSRQYEEKKEKRYVESILSSKTRENYSKF